MGLRNSGTQLRWAIHRACPSHFCEQCEQNASKRRACPRRLSFGCVPAAAPRPIFAAAPPAGSPPPAARLPDGLALKLHPSCSNTSTPSRRTSLQLSYVNSLPTRKRSSSSDRLTPTRLRSVDSREIAKDGVLPLEKPVPEHSNREEGVFIRRDEHARASYGAGICTQSLGRHSSECVPGVYIRSRREQVLRCTTRTVGFTFLLRKL